MNTPHKKYQNQQQQQQNHHDHNHSQSGCAVCAERGFVTKTPIPHFRKQPITGEVGPETVCHGCVERQAILAEVSGLRDMVLALSNGMLELNNTVSQQKKRITNLETQLAAAAIVKEKTTTSPYRQQRNHADPSSSTSAASSSSSLFVGGEGDVSQQHHNLIGISQVVEKMLKNSSYAIESRIAANVRDSESRRQELESRSIREDVQKRITELEREYDRKILNMDSKFSVADRQAKEAIATNDRRVVRTIYQLCQSLNVAVPPAMSNDHRSSSSAGQFHQHHNNNNSQNQNPSPANKNTNQFYDQPPSSYSFSSNSSHVQAHLLPQAQEPEQQQQQQQFQYQNNQQNQQQQQQTPQQEQDLQPVVSAASTLSTSGGRRTTSSAITSRSTSYTSDTSPGSTPAVTPLRN